MLFMLAEADGDQHEYEDVYINRVGMRLGFTNEEIREIDQSPQKMTFSIPKEEHERMIILYDLLFLMKFDDVVDQSEIDLIHRLGFRMGFRPTMTKEMIGLVSQYLGRPVPKEALLNVVRKYLN